MRFFTWLCLIDILSLAGLCDAFMSKANGSSRRKVRSQYPTGTRSSFFSNDAKHSFVEEEKYDDRFAEIEAMGGDPFFMDEDHESDERSVKTEDHDATVLDQNSHLSSLIAKASATTSRSATDGLGPTPRQKESASNDDDKSWEWDGNVDEDAHLGLD
mmetsp:Transcript_26433/g.72692  ORF Transcript_26433/g.72692 Transcript_26433/m.72692 type:complete len:158 (-) Transcript_26433:5504-5977(-)